MTRVASTLQGLQYSTVQQAVFRAVGAVFIVRGVEAVGAEEIVAQVCGRQQLAAQEKEVSFMCAVIAAQAVLDNGGNGRERLADEDFPQRLRGGGAFGGIKAEVAEVGQAGEHPHQDAAGMISTIRITHRPPGLRQDFQLQSAGATDDAGVVGGPQRSLPMPPGRRQPLPHLFHA
ncbi:hypothetical protein HMPREF9080_01820 [Cardiobacterium valvarum F0432]|uniref:Uncharacterized protein n=1 Tax=Cardiobacterium valvarum F0432 TaxID=797473 RepID=G9ZGB7_9GAMM|nr:hypothetical protein HMPREF9080_01820 [Cardiobacterium valvarum F0432]